MTASLAAWLLVQFAADEAAARVKDVGHTNECRMDYDAELPVPCSCDGPARVLATVAAHRAIVERRLDAEFPDFDGGYSTAIDDVIRDLAQVYSDRPGFQPEWRVET